MTQYVVDAFTDKIFGGNPAAICVMDEWISDSLMLNIAGENNLSETAFIVKEGEMYRLRWFTPSGEIDLCGHATLASAYVIMNFVDKNASEIAFTTLSGILTVIKRGDLYEMDFPAYELKPVPVTKEIIDAAGATPTEAYMGRDLLCVFPDESIVRELTPDMEKLKKLEGLLFHATAKGKETDSVSRSFAPKVNVVEDPVCGSGHCHIIPYWSNALGKAEIIAYQASKRGGTLYCALNGKRVKLAGKAVLFSVGEINPY